jgi:hypothetical protein
MLFEHIRKESNMLEEIEKISPPNWLMSDEFVFNLKEILDKSLFYPCSGDDGEPVRVFLGNVYSFVYSDYGKTRKDLIDLLETSPFRGYRIIHQESILEEELYLNTCGAWYKSLNINNHPFQNYASLKYQIDDIKPFFCEWIIFQNEVGKRFSLLFVSAESLATYMVLYSQNSFAPQIVTILHPGAMNWTDFLQEDGYLSKAISENSNKNTPYIFHNSMPWKSHPNIILEEKEYSSNMYGTLWGSKNRELNVVNPPNWLMEDHFKFDLEMITADSLFFPYSELIKTPLELFKRRIFSFIYVDYLFQKDVFEQEFILKSLYGYSPIFKQSIDYEQLRHGEYEETMDIKHVLDDTNPLFSPEIESENVKAFMKRYFCEWIVYENKDKERFSLLYIAADALLVYLRLHYLTRIPPKVLLIHKHTLPDLYWTNIADENSMFYKIVVKMPENAAFESRIELTPTFIAVINQIIPWSDYNEYVFKLGDYAIWRRKD